MTRALALAAALLLVQPAAHAVDSMSVELGTSDSSNSDVDLVRLGLQWNWGKRFALGQDWHIGGFWDLSLGYWNNDSPGRTNSSLGDLGFTPVFRLQQTNPGALAPYLEAGVGAHLLSKSSVSTERRFGTLFNFGSHLGIGLRFGDKQAFDVGYRYQHLSNASIKEPNQGINFHLVRLQYHF
jgi:opacity protein-like surface antigen